MNLPAGFWGLIWIGVYSCTLLILVGLIGLLTTPAYYVGFGFVLASGVIALLCLIPFVLTQADFVRDHHEKQQEKMGR